MAPKPRGLAASKKRVATVTPLAPVVRTAPVDEDHLTILDLFELRSSALELLDPTTDETKDESERQEEARGLLRGILHACESLALLLESTEEGESIGKLRKALGLENPRAKGQLAYLQAFALHQFSTILPPPLSALSTSNAAGGSHKKRKVDLGEPVGALEWLEFALQKFEVAVRELKETSRANGESKRWLSLSCTEYIRALCDRAAVDLNKFQTSGGAYVDLAKEILQLGVESLGNKGEINLVAQDEENCDVETALLRSVASLLSLIEVFPTAETTSTELESIQFLVEIVEIPHLFDIVTMDSTMEEDLVRRDYDVAVLKGDIHLHRFLTMEDELEQKYRPEEEQEDAEEDEESVIPMPNDADDVKSVKKVGECVIKLLDHSIRLHSSLSADDQLLSNLNEQYSKLEVAYLTYSALLNTKAEQDIVNDKLTVVRASISME